MGKFAAECGDSKAQIKYKIPESTARCFRTIYTSLLAKCGPNLNLSSLPLRKRGAPTLLPPKINTNLREYIQALRQNGGVVTSVIIRAVATALVESDAPYLLPVNNGNLTLSKYWSFETAKRFGLSRRKATRSTKAEVQNNEVICKDFRDSFESTTVENHIPNSLIFNLDETGLNLIPSSSWTMETEGAKQVKYNLAK